MRLLLLSVYLLLSLNVSALPVSSGEYVGSGECEKATVTNETDNDFLLSANPADDRVKILVALKETFIDEVIFSRFKTSIVASLRKSGDSIVHLATGAVCSRFEKRGIIGGPMWVDKHHCRFFSKDRFETIPDRDGFENKQICSRDYFMYVK